MALITADYFNQQMKTLGLKSTFTPEAEVLDTLIAEASAWIEDFCGRKFEAQSVTEVLRGRGYNRLVLDNYPINSITSIDWVDDSGATGTVATSDVRILDGGILEFKNPLDGPWYATRTYTVAYNTGFSTIPGPIKRATALKVVDLMQPMYSGAREARQVELISDIEGKVLDLVERYRRERLG